MASTHGRILEQTQEVENGGEGEGWGGLQGLLPPSPDLSDMYSVGVPSKYPHTGQYKRTRYVSTLEVSSGNKLVWGGTMPG